MSSRNSSHTSNKMKLIRKLLSAFCNLVICFSVLTFDFTASGLKLSHYANASQVMKAKENNAENKAAQEQLSNDVQSGTAQRYTQCEETTLDQEQRRENERNDRAQKIEENFAEIDRVTQKLMDMGGRIGELGQATQGIGLQGNGQDGNIFDRDAVRQELAVIDGQISQAYSAWKSFKCERRRNSGEEWCTSEELSKRNALRMEYYRLLQRKNELRSKLWTVTVSEGGAAVGNANAAVDAAHTKSASLEQAYNELIHLVNSQTPRVQAELDQAYKDYEDDKFNQVNNAEYEMFQAALGDLTDDPSDPEAHKIYQEKMSNLEIMSMASSAINLLHCEDISDVKSKAYPLFKAASANYIASQINDTSDFTRAVNCLTQCVAIEEIIQDQTTHERDPNRMKYPEFHNKIFTNVIPNCKTKENKDGLFINDNNADDDKNEQIKVVERAVNLHDQFVTANELKVATRENALLMFQSAYEAALDELTTKQTRVAAAEAQLAKAKAWQEKDKNSIIIYIGIVAMLATCASWSCPGAYAAAVAILLWLRNDKKKADAAVAKWRKELANARVHGLMKCNYPGAAATVEKSQSPRSVPLTHARSIINQRVTAEVRFKKINSPTEVYAWNEFLKEFKFGFKEQSLSMAKSLTDFLFPHAHATDSFSAQLGMSQQSGAFRRYMDMRVGAWQLQTFNAALLVNLRDRIVSTDGLHPAAASHYTLRDYTKDNTSKYNGRAIEKTGFPLPETRALYIQSIVQMITDNLNMIGCGAGINVSTMNDAQITSACSDSTLARAINNRDQYVRLLDKMKTKLSLDNEGHEDDTSPQEMNPTSACLAPNSSGQITTDPNCDCSSSNSCSSFLIPRFGNLGTGVVSNSALATIDGANAITSGDLDKANVAAGSLKTNAKATQSSIAKFHKKLDRNRIKAGLKSSYSPSTYSKSDSKKSSSKKTDKLDSDHAGMNDFLNSTSKKRINASEKEMKDKLLSETKSLEAQKQALLNGVIRPKSSSSKSARANKPKALDKKDINLGLGSIKFGDSPDGADPSINLDSINGLKSNSPENKNDQEEAAGSTLSNEEYAANSEYYNKKHSHKRSRNRDKSNGKQISNDTKSSIFKIISKRYKRSAYPDLYE